MLAALIGAGIAVANGVGSYVQANRQEINNRAALNAQNEWNLAQWNRENEYNSPKAQMQRFIDAGLNPNLIYGQGTPGNASHLTSANLEPKEARNFGDALSTVLPAIMNLKLQEAQLNKTQKETESVELDNALKSQYGSEKAQLDLEAARIKKDSMMQDFQQRREMFVHEMKSALLRNQISQQEYDFALATFDARVQKAKDDAQSVYFDVLKKETYSHLWKEMSEADLKSKVLANAYQNLQNVNAEDRHRLNIQEYDKNDLEYIIKSSNFEEWLNSKSARDVRFGIENGDLAFAQRNLPTWIRRLGISISDLLPILKAIK